VVPRQLSRGVISSGRVSIRPVSLWFASSVISAISAGWEGEDELLAPFRWANRRGDVLAPGWGSVAGGEVAGADPACAPMVLGGGR